MHQTDNQIVDRLQQEYDRPFEGWDFSGLEHRLVNLGDLPWDYISLVRHCLRDATSLLDIGTGGGEVLDRILSTSTFSGRVEAAEAHPPNLAVAKRRLGPHGVLLHDALEQPVAFDDGRFDLVIDRHCGALEPPELFRILSARGHYVTQQVGAHTNDELRTLFNVDRTLWPNQPRDIEDASTRFTEAGFVIERLKEASYVQRFMDVGALVYYLKAVPFEVPGFSVEAYADKLIALHRDAPRKGYAIDATFHAWMLVARKG